MKVGRKISVKYISNNITDCRKTELRYRYVIIEVKDSQYIVKEHYNILRP